MTPNELDTRRTLVQALHKLANIHEAVPGCKLQAQMLREVAEFHEKEIARLQGLETQRAWMLKQGIT